MLTSACIRPVQRCLMIAMLVLGAAALPVWGADIYVSPTGDPNSDGSSIGNPTTLHAAISRTLTPGTTVNLLGGTYQISHTAIPQINANWQGTSTDRITLRSAPGQWATIDGRLNVQGARYVTLRDFAVTRTSDVNLDDPNWWNLPENTRPAPNFQMGGSLIETYSAQSLQLINLHLHDNISGNALGAWNASNDMLTYGNIIVRNGWEDAGRGHGHGAYIQNASGAGASDPNSIKRFENNISALNHSTGMKTYTTNPDVSGTHFYRNTFFGNGMLSWTNGTSNYLAGSVNGYVEDVLLHENHFYQPDSTTGDLGGTVYLGWGNDDMRTVTFTNNHVFGGGSSALRAQNWSTLTVTGNTIYDDKRLVEAYGYDANTDQWVWNQNTYYGSSAADLFNNLTFAEWQALTGFDSNSTLNGGALPGLEVFIVANDFDANRAHVTLYNWAHQDQVDVDLSSVLALNAPFVIYDSLDFMGTPLAQGVYQGGLTTLTLNDHPVLGNEFHALIVQTNVPEPGTLTLGLLGGGLMLLRRGRRSQANRGISCRG